MAPRHTRHRAPKAAWPVAGLFVTGHAAFASMMLTTAMTAPAKAALSIVFAAASGAALGLYTGWTRSRSTT